jgi:hypothetical protein
LNQRPASLVAAFLTTTALFTQGARGEPAPKTDSASAVAPTLEQQFVDPPMSARPRVWWHWMNGNITKDGIAKDLAWMKRVGIGGLQNFDVNLATPQIVDKRLVYMTPEWKDAFRFATTEVDRLGLELAIAASPGWSETGGPWVKPDDGLKKVVWSQTLLTAGMRAVAPLPLPPQVTGPFLDLALDDKLAQITGVTGPKPAQAYTDIAVLAWPVSPVADAVAKVTGPDGKPLDAAKLTDDSLETGLTLPRGTDDNPATVAFIYAAPQTIRTATLFIAGAKGMFSGATVDPRLEASDDGKAWSKVIDIPVSEAPTTVAFTPVTARQFRVVLANAPFRGSNLGASAPGVDPGPFVQMMAAGAKAPIELRQLALSSSPRIDRYESKAGFAIEMDYYALGQPDAAAPAIDPASVVDLTNRLRPDGTLDWTPPKGTWHVLRVGATLVGTTNHPAPVEATGLEVDKFDGDAVHRYLDHHLGMYKHTVGPRMIGARGVRALLTDSIEVGAANWTPKMVAQFKRLRGYDPTPWFPALTGTIIGSRDRSDRFLYDYRRTLADLMASEHYGTIARVAHESGLKIYGEALEDKRPSLGDDMAMRSHADVPMAALWTYAPKDGPNPSYVADMKGASSVAHVYGQNLAAAESMTAAMAPWAYAPNDLRRFIDLEFATGINRPVIHTSVHQPVDDKIPGLSLMIFGQYFNRHESWAEMARPWVDYMARTSLLLQQGRNVADVAYFYGEEAPITGLYGLKPIADAPKAHAWDFVGADALVNALKVQGNEIISQGGARYQAIQLGGSSSRMTLRTLKRLASLVEDGATIIGSAPVANPGLDDNPAEYAALVARLWPGGPIAEVGTGRVFATHDSDKALAVMDIAPDFDMPGAAPDANVMFVHRALADGEVWFLANRLARTETIQARFRVTGKQPELWHADTGTAEAVSYRIGENETVVPMQIAPESSVFVVFRKPATERVMVIKKTSPVTLSTITGPWQVAFQPGRGAPASITMPALAPLDQLADPAVKYFSGVATYSRTFIPPKAWKRGQPLWIDLGEVAELAQVMVNGKDAGIAWHAPFRLDISSAVKPGHNALEVRVANLWVNRLVGDAQPGARKVTFTAAPTYTADAPLRRSGLIGPVTLGTGR